jgi:hypothetical protein
VAALMPSPRRQHYDFAHRLLPKLIADSPDRVLDILAGEQGDSFVEQMWRFAAEGVPEAQRIAERPVRHVRHLPMGQLAVILALPPAAAVTEAHLVAIVSTAPKGARYFTLESGVDFPEETARTVFCEWTSGSHVNFGSGPAAEVDPFLDVVEAQVSPRQ